MKVEVPIKASVAGRYRLVKHKQLPDGSLGECTYDGPWFNNLITDTGLNRHGSGAGGGNARVGSGSTTPAFSDTTLVAQIASTSTTTVNDSGVSASAPWYAWRRRTFRFAEGVAAGNISEVGIGWASTGSTLFSRALILDALGDPTTITVLSDEVLDVSYELRLYSPTADTTFDFDIGATTHSCVCRPSEVNNGSSWSVGMLDYSYLGPGSNVLTVIPYQGPIGTTLQRPSGTSTGGGSNTVPAYSNNSLIGTCKTTLSLTQGNLSGGIGAFFLQSSSLGAYQISITPKIEKDATKVLTVDFSVSWSRFTP